MTSFVREVRAETGVPMSHPCAQIRDCLDPLIDYKSINSIFFAEKEDQCIE